MKTELITIVRQLRTAQLAQDQYIDSLPMDIRSVVFDTEYVHLQERKTDLLMRELFGAAYEDVTWFLYTVRFSELTAPHIITVDGTEYTFHSDEDYYTYLETV